MTDPTRPGAPDEVLRDVAGWRPKVTSWRGADMLAETVPIIRGRLDVDISQEVPERLTVTVPEVVDRVSWVPADNPVHPLAYYGQALDVSVMVSSVVTGAEYPTRLGTYPIQEWDYSDTAATVDVEAVGLLQRIADDRFPNPEAPRYQSTLASEFRRLTPGGIPVQIHPDLEDRPCPTSFQWDEDRLKALYDIADAWPARLRTSSFGEVLLLPPLPDKPLPVMTFTDGEGGNLVSAPQSGSRDGIYNAVVVRGANNTDPAWPPVWAEVQQTSGPMDVLRYGVVRRFYSSPLLYHWQQAYTTAAVLLRQSVRTSTVVTCEIAPDPRIDVDVPVRVVRGNYHRVGYVVGYSMPLTVADGRMTVKVAVG